MIKGIAICLMLIRHLFYDANSIHLYNYDCILHIHTKLLRR